MHRLQQKRGRKNFCYIYRGPVAPVTPPLPPVTPTPPIPPPPPINDNEQQLIDDIQAALTAFIPQKQTSDETLDNLRYYIESNHLTYQQEHQLRLNETNWLLNLLLDTHIATMTSLIGREVEQDVRSGVLIYMLNQIYQIEEELVQNVVHERYGLRTDIGDLWTRFLAQHNTLGQLLDTLAEENKPGGEDTYNPDDNQTDTSTVRDGLQALIDQFLNRITELTNSAVAKVQELEAMFLIEDIPKIMQTQYRKDNMNMNYSMLSRYSGSPDNPWLDDEKAVNGLLTSFAPFNLAERNAFKPLYNEEDILLTLFNNQRLIPPASTGVRFEDEHIRLKGIIDNAPVG
jgi:hypothetical protein